MEDSNDKKLPVKVGKIAPQSITLLDDDEIAKDKQPKGDKRKCTCKSITIAFFAVFIVFVIVLLIGAAVEKSNYENAATTIGYYSTKRVCGAKVNETLPIIFGTYDNVDTAHANGAKIVNCGDCGHCSNRRDINLYNVTRNTLTKTTTACATKAFLGGASSVRNCMEEGVGLTDDCNTCWVDNVMCDMRKCVFTCIKSLILGGGEQQGGNNKAKEDSGGEIAGDNNTMTMTNENLNDCLLCDEKLCGPAFIECAGANRRRSGIFSDIGRDDANEVCKVIDIGWWKP